VARELPSDMMALSEAAAVAHAEIFRGLLAKSPDALDVIATALSGHLSIFGMRDPKAGRTPLTEDDYANGAFRHGATRFERRDGTIIAGLSVRKADFERMLRTLRPPRDDKSS
jgi:hypothetical protein